MRRDTVQVPAGSSATLRLTADNPGVWLLHCHIEWHLEAGLAVFLVEAPLEMEQRAWTVQPPPKALAKQCHTHISRHPAVLISRHAAGRAPWSALSGLVTGPSLPSMILTVTAGCVLVIVVIGMRIVIRGGALSDEEVERDVRSKLATKMKRGRLFGTAH